MERTFIVKPTYGLNTKKEEKKYYKLLLWREEL